MVPVALASDGGDGNSDGGDGGSDGGGGSSDGDDGGSDGGDGGSDGGGSGDADGQPSDDGSSADERPSTAERIAMGVSVVLTLALFAFVVWNGLAGASQAGPQVTVEATHPTDDGRTAHEIRVSNPGDRGFQRVTVLVTCGDAPREVVIDHLPPRSAHAATVLCPGETRNPPTSVLSWQGG